MNFTPEIKCPWCGQKRIAHTRFFPAAPLTMWCGRCPGVYTLYTQVHYATEKIIEIEEGEEVKDGR